jgi:enoyl reductase-like protein
MSVNNSSELNNYLERIEERFIEFQNRQTQPLFKNFKLLDKNVKYKNECIHCKNTDVFTSSQYLLQRCNKCRKEYEPIIIQK